MTVRNFMIPFDLILQTHTQQKKKSKTVKYVRTQTEQPLNLPLFD